MTVIATLGFAFIAGLLSLLSPCVLPLLPLVLGAAASEHKFGPAALASGLALSFVIIGLFIATIGYSLGLNATLFRNASAFIMVALGMILIVPALQAWTAQAGAPVANWAERTFGGVATKGLYGQFGVGVLLGAVWSPCVGPTLGAASLLAAQGTNLSEVALTMLVFGIGAAIPLLVLGMLSREALVRMRGTMLSSGKSAKMAMGVLLLLIGVPIASGYDRQIETLLVDASPEWLTQLTTRF
jgi:cytochrome c-type biogenesis protein